MTRDEILAMEPGREMDELIEQYVFEHEVVTVVDMFKKELRMAKIDVNMVSIQPYSKLIGAAWEVVEKIRPLFWSTQVMTWDHSDKYVVSCVYRGGHNEPERSINADGNTAPLAICRVALLAMMDNDA